MTPEGEWLKAVEGVPFHPPCFGCGRAIGEHHFASAVEIRRRDPRTGLWYVVGNGAMFHAACATRWAEENPE